MNTLSIQWFSFLSQPEVRMKGSIQEFFRNFVRFIVFIFIFSLRQKWNVPLSMIRLQTLGEILPLRKYQRHISLQLASQDPLPLEQSK